MSEFEPQQSGISRRTVTKAMAWAVPAIAVAAPVPAFAAASQGIVTLNGGGCKLPGNSNPVYKGNVFRLQINNTTNSPITVTITGVFLNGQNLGAFSVINLTGCTVLGASIPVGANSSLNNLAIRTADAGNSENGTLTVTYTVTGMGGEMEAESTVSAVPPINGASCNTFSPDEKTCITTAA